MRSAAQQGILMTAWCLGVIAQPALSPQRCVIDGIHPPDECVSLRQPALKDLWRIREALSAVSLTSLLFSVCLSHTYPVRQAAPHGVYAFLHIQMCQKWIQWCKGINTKRKVSAYTSIHINRLIVFSNQRATSPSKALCVLSVAKYLSLLLTLPVVAVFFSIRPSLLFFFSFSPSLHSLSSRGLWSQTQWQDPNLENEMKCSSLFTLVAIFFWLKFEGIGIGSELEANIILAFILWFILFTPVFRLGSTPNKPVHCLFYCLTRELICVLFQILIVYRGATNIILAMSFHPK